MNIRTVCLAILYCGDATGYEIKKLSVEGKYSYFVDASFGSIYPGLAKLQADGMVTVREETQPGKPSRKIYSITEKGREALVESLSEAPQPDVFKSEFLLVAQFSKLIGPEKIKNAIDMRLAHLREERDHLEKMAQDSGKASNWTCRYGLHCISTSIDYLEKNRGELEKEAGAAWGSELDHKETAAAIAE